MGEYGAFHLHPPPPELEIRLTDRAEAQLVPMIGEARKRDGLARPSPVPAPRFAHPTSEKAKQGKSPALPLMTRQEHPAQTKKGISNERKEKRREKSRLKRQEAARKRLASEKRAPLERAMCAIVETPIRRGRRTLDPHPGPGPECKRQPKQPPVFQEPGLPSLHGRDTFKMSRSLRRDGQ